MRLTPSSDSHDRAHHSPKIVESEQTYGNMSQDDEDEEIGAFDDLSGKDTARHEEQKVAEKAQDYVGKTFNIFNMHQPIEDDIHRIEEEIVEPYSSSS